ncbi:hypothetical protein Bbelb_028290 [Branchiostoma belcheri]|nr:hypothetical protein Bbelb_028290 [Branchiostoma belcheri]
MGGYEVQNLSEVRDRDYYRQAFSSRTWYQGIKVALPKRHRSSDNQLRHAYKTNIGLFVTRQYETATEGDGHTTRLSGTTTTCASDQLPKKDFEADTPYKNNSNLC